jgi:hypothetical protein
LFIYGSKFISKISIVRINVYFLNSLCSSFIRQKIQVDTIILLCHYHVIWVYIYDNDMYVRSGADMEGEGTTGLSLPISWELHVRVKIYHIFLFCEVYWFHLIYQFQCSSDVYPHLGPSYATNFLYNIVLMLLLCHVSNRHTSIVQI